MNPRKNPSEKRRITLEDLAQAAGISRSAASKAMRGHPRVSEATRQRVQALASEMGYVRDPALSRLAHYRWQSIAPDRGVPVAYLFPFTSGGHLDQSMRIACEKVFTTNGFNFQVFYCRDQSPARLRQILRARGIRSVIFQRVFDPEVARLLCSPEFSCVDITEGPFLPSSEIIRSDFLWALRDAIERHRAAGRNRLALILHRGNLNTALGSHLEAIWCHEKLPEENIVRPDPGPLTELEGSRLLAKNLEPINPEGLVFFNWPQYPASFWRQLKGYEPGREIVLRLLEEQIGEVNGYCLRDERLALRALHYLEGRLRQSGSRDTLYGMTLMRPEWCPVESPD